ncbi:MAG: hypothetical protein CMJ45_03270 [Planctomyces sp.]|nr:hypothetical protein [Planctomyces sp.]
MPDEKEDLFDSSGESLGYISMEQAGVLAIQHAQNNTGFYDSSIRHEPLVWEIEGQVETDDFYEIRISFRPTRNFQGQPGIERFTIDKTGKVELRMIVRELVRETGTEGNRESAPRDARPSPSSPFPWQIVGGITVSLVAALLIFWVFLSFIGGDDPDEEPRVVAKPAATSTPVPIVATVPPTTVPTPTLGPAATVPPPTPTPIQIRMASSITKWEWLEDAVEVFNTASASDSIFQVNGRPIQVEILLEEDPLTGRLRHWNSPTQVAATVRGEIEPTILSPASITWISKLNKDW